MIKVFSIEPPVNSRPTAASPSADSSERRRLIEALTQSISIRLKDITNEALVEACQLDSRKDDLMKNNRFATKYIIAKDRLDRSTQQKNDLEYWVKEVGSRSDNVSIDEVLCYADALDEQIAQCSAEDQSYGDALDQIDEAFVKGVIDHDAYMKHIRDLSRGQFFPRALRKKIEVVRAKKVHQQVDTDPASSRARPNVATLPMYSM